MRRHKPQLQFSEMELQRIPYQSGRVRVIKDTRDGSKDYWLLQKHALELYDRGLLHRDITNGCFGEP